MPASLVRLPATTPTEQIHAALARDGALIIEDLLDAATLARINAGIEPLLAGTDPEMTHLNPTITAFFGPHVRHLSGLAGKSRSFATDVMCHPLYLALCDGVLLPNCAEYVLNLGHLMDRGPGADRQWLHRDEDIWVHVPRPHPELMLASVIALVDFSAANGATVIAPGSHHWPRDRQADESELAVAEMQAGSAVIYLGSTLHAGGGNTTASDWRRGIHLSYALGWLRTEENNVLAVPPAVARSLPERAQRLLGYGVHDAIAQAGGYLGMVDLQDPNGLLNAGRLG
jgi:ectoine hydroxylase-related dioxygenase (phytanoyl-CoA dioxygenase family)